MVAMDVCPELASGAVVHILSEWALPQIELWVTYPAGRFATTKAGAFVHWFLCPLVSRHHELTRARDRDNHEPRLERFSG